MLFLMWNRTKVDINVDIQSKIKCVGGLEGKKNPVPLVSLEKPIWCQYDYQEMSSGLEKMYQECNSTSIFSKSLSSTALPSTLERPNENYSGFPNWMDVLHS